MQFDKQSLTAKSFNFTFVTQQLKIPPNSTDKNKNWIKIRAKLIQIIRMKRRPERESVAHINPLRSRHNISGITLGKSGFGSSQNFLTTFAWV